MVPGLEKEGTIVHRAIGVVLELGWVDLLTVALRSSYCLAWWLNFSVLSEPNPGRRPVRPPHLPQGTRMLCTRATHLLNFIMLDHW